MKKLIIAVDFDGTLCEYDFPRIGRQSDQQTDLLKTLIRLKSDGHYIILWTNRGDKDGFNCLTEAVDWCRNQGLNFDQVNKNNPEMESNKLSGYSPKIMADVYIDDKALGFGNPISRTNTLDFLRGI